MTDRDGAEYYKVVMELVIRLDQKKAYIELLCGRTVDMLGNTGAAGSRLASKIIPLPVRDPAPVAAQHPAMEPGFASL